MRVCVSGDSFGMRHFDISIQSVCMFGNSTVKGLENAHNPCLFEKVDVFEDPLCFVCLVMCVFVGGCVGVCDGDSLCLMSIRFFPDYSVSGEYSRLRLHPRSICTNTNEAIGHCR